MDPIKEAFAKAKQDINDLNNQINEIKEQIDDLKRIVIALSESKTNQQTNKPTDFTLKHSNIAQKQTDNAPTDTLSTDMIPQYGLKTSNNLFSIGNDGVPTDRPTNQQTDRQSGFLSASKEQKVASEDKITHLEKVSEVLASLDELKKEIRHKFKHLTAQEMVIFSTIYELEEKGFVVDYSLISQKLGLSESSIREYVQKIIKKGIPIIKNKENNKKILLRIDPNLKKIASLPTIVALRDL